MTRFYSTVSMNSHHWGPPSRRKVQKGVKMKKCAGWHQPSHLTELPLSVVHFMDHRILKFCPSCIRDVLADASLSEEDRRIVETAYNLSLVFSPPA